MKDINIFCFGFGQVAKSFIKKLQSEKLNIKLSVTSRGKSESKKFKKRVFANISRFATKASICLPW